MRPYLSIVKMRFVVMLQYRAATVAGFFTQVFFGFVRVMVFHGFYASTVAVMPMSLEQAITYEWMVQATLAMLPWNADEEVLDLIRTGNVVYELCRPLELYFIWYSRLLSLRLVPTLMRGIPIFLMTLFLPTGYGMTLPVSPAAGLAWGVSIFCALLLGCAVSNIIAIATLWTVAGDGARRIIPALVTFLSGTIVPLVYFPDWAQNILLTLPFSGLVDIPLRFYLGLLPVSNLPGFILLQLGWTVVFIAVGMLLLKVAMRRVVIQGG